MKHFTDGDQVVITKDDFENLQESPAVFIPADSTFGQAVRKGGTLELPLGTFMKVSHLLKDGGGKLSGEWEGDR